MEVVEKSAMIKEYFDIYTEKVKEYGEKTCVLYENGSFYEIYQIDNEYEKIGNASVLSHILNGMTYTSKVIGKMRVNFIGFNTSCLDKFLPLLLNANYTVAIVNQLESSENRVSKGNLKRGVTRTYSPSLQPIDYNSGSLVFLLIKVSDVKSSLKKNAKTVYNIETSVCSINNENNVIELSENNFVCDVNDGNCLNQSLDEVDRVLFRYFAREIQIRIDCEEDFWGKRLLEEYFENNYENITVRYIGLSDYKDMSENNSFLREVYSHKNMGMLEAVEYMDLQSYEFSVKNLVIALEFIGRHDASYLKNLNLPIHTVDTKNLVLELNTVSQLNILKSTNKNTAFGSVFDVINHTKTAIGKRHLQYLLCKPFKTKAVIEERYTITEEVRPISKELDLILSNIYDFEKLHRKMCLSQLHPFEFQKLDATYSQLIRLIELLNDKCEAVCVYIKDTTDFKEYVEDYRNKLNLDVMKGIDLNTGKDDIKNYFKVGVVPELDIIQSKILELETEREELRQAYDTLLLSKGNEMVKLVYTDNDGYSFQCTKIRFETLKTKDTSLKNCRMKQSNNSVKFYPDKLMSLSTSVLNHRDLLYKKIKLHYTEMLKLYFEKYNHVFLTLKTLVEIVDVCNSNSKSSSRYCYTKPQVVDTEESFFKATQLRHPIIERLGTRYIPNDISLNNEKNGMLLYSINSGGKSSLLRAIGISVILAQCGLYVPSKEFVFSPFDTIISQVDFSDNLFSGKSSYITEMMGLKKILKCCGSRTLVLSDELCKGTESNSSISLVSSTIKKLLDTNTKFFFTSHLHEIAKLEMMRDYNNLQIKHLDISIKNGKDIVFNRLLKDGSGSELYGLEISQSILNDPELIDCAFEIRNNLVGNSELKSKKKSVYNKKKVIKKCEICGSTKNLETDHIVPQKLADDVGYLDGYHKNEKFNLAVLCKSCHLKKTQEKIVIEGYQDTSNGRVLVHYEVK